MYRQFFRALAAVAATYVAFFTAELFFEWHRLGMPGTEATSWVDVNDPKLMDLMSPVARGYNNVLAMLIATIGLAIPLTANMHTPKLIEMFLRDPLNQVVLFTEAFGAANVLWVAYMVGPHFAPTWAIALAVGGALVGWAVLIPYFFYVVRFLDPVNILDRLERETEKAIDAVANGRLDSNAGQSVVHGRLQEIGTIVVKSLDRTDRDVATHGIWLFKRLLDYHGARKARMPAGWFVVDRADFVGTSAEALEILQEDKVFFERKVLDQLFFAYTHAISKAKDIVSSISDANRVVAELASARGDERSLELSIRYFNNFLREAIKGKHVHSVYDVFYQYRLLAQHLGDHPEHVRDITDAMASYALDARRAGLALTPSFATFDLAVIVLDAYRRKLTVAPDVLACTLAMPEEVNGAREPLVIEGKMKLGAALASMGEQAAAARVRACLSGVSEAELVRMKNDLLGARRQFREVTDRQVDMRWVRPEDRAALDAFVASCASS